MEDLMMQNLPIQKSTPTKALKRMDKADYNMDPLAFNLKFNN